MDIHNNINHNHSKMKNQANTVFIRFGASIKTRRLSKSMSQEELAQQSGLHPTYISQIEQGKRNITLATIEKLALALEISITDIFSN